MFSDEELEKHIDILGGDRRRVDGEGAGEVREGDFGELVEEKHIGVGRPAVWDRFHIRGRRKRRGIITD